MLIFSFIQNSKTTFIQTLFCTFKNTFFSVQTIQKARKEKYATTNHSLKAHLYLPSFYRDNIKE